MHWQDWFPIIKIWVLSYDKVKLLLLKWSFPKLVLGWNRLGKGDDGASGSSSSFTEVLWASSKIKFKKEARRVDTAFRVTGRRPCSLFYWEKIYCEDNNDEGSLEDKSMRSVFTITEISSNNSIIIKFKFKSDSEAMCAHSFGKLLPIGILVPQF